MSGFYPGLWASKTLQQMVNELKTNQRILNTITDYTPLTIGKQVNAYNGPTLTAVDAASMPIADESFTNPTKSYVQIAFDQKYGVPQILSDIENAQSNLDLLSLYTDNAKEGLLDKYDAYIISALIAGLNASNRLLLADTVDDNLSVTDFLTARKTLNAAGAPLKGRTCVVNAEHEADLYEIDSFISRDKISDAVAMKEGIIGRCLGFDVILYSDMPEVSSAGLESGTQNRYVSLFYSKLAYGFGRQKEFGVKSQPAAGAASDYLNIYSVFGGVIQFDTYAVSMRDNNA